jgi:hypothetical protein
MAAYKLSKEAAKINVFIHNVEDLEKHQSKFSGSWFRASAITTMNKTNKMHNQQDVHLVGFIHCCYQSKYYSKWIPKVGIFPFCDSVVLKEQIEPEAYRRWSSFKESQEAATLPSTYHADRAGILPATISCRRSFSISAVEVSGQ